MIFMFIDHLKDKNTAFLDIILLTVMLILLCIVSCP